MPVIRLKKWRLESLTGASWSELEETLFRLKCELEDREDYAQIEVNSDRPDMLIGEGIARAIHGLMGKRKGWKLPDVVESSVRLKSESVPSRPYIACAVIRNVNVDSEDFLEELIQFQEKLHDGLGRRRRKAAIGLHDLDKLPSREVVYTMASIDSRFKPLGSREESTIASVLAESDKGREYGGIALYEKMHPALISGGEIIAIPPVLNSDITRVEVGTRHLFIDVTGTDERVVSMILDIIASTLAERRGAIVEYVSVSRWNGVSARYPVFNSRSLRIPSDYFEKTLGVKLETGDVVEHLERMLHNVSVSDNLLNVSVAPFRVDVMGWVDLAEDVAISIGYDKIAEGSRESRLKTRGSLLEETRLSRKIRELLLGLGFTEVMRLTLTSPSLLALLGVENEAIRVSNPVQHEYSMLKPVLAASILEVMRESQHREKPIKIFELGLAASRTASGEVFEDSRLGLGLLDYSVGYEDIQAVIYALLRLLGLKFTVESSSIPFFIKGRQAFIKANGVVLGWMGEIHPRILEALGIEYPVALSEISLKALTRRLQTK